MSENRSDAVIRTLCERGARYVVGTEGYAVAVLLTLADSRDAELATCLAQAAAHPTSEERQSFRDYLRQRETSRAEVQS